MSKKTQYCPYCGENHTYCIWCGEDLEKGHDERCPLVHGIQTKNGYITYGFKAKPDDPEWNLHLGRLAILFSIGAGPYEKTTFGPLDQEVKMRLAHEQFSFSLYRANTELFHVENQNRLKRFFAGRKINKLEKDRVELKEYALELLDSVKLPKERKKYWRKKIEEVYSRGRVLLYSHI